MNNLVGSKSSAWSQLSWSAAELHQRGTWRCDLPAAVRNELLEFAVNEPLATEETFEWQPAHWPCLVTFGRQVKQHLLAGDGVLCLQGLGLLGLDNAQLRCFYVAFGCALGQPMLQYGRLHPVMDRGASYKTQSVPVSMTNSETCFHTDSSAVDVVPDFVGLLCEQPSQQGGDSLVSNALRIHSLLQRDAPKLLESLRRNKFRDVVTPGKEKTHENLLRNRFPIFADSDCEGGVLFRYMRYWIEVGHRKAGVSLGAAEVEAMDRLDALLQHPDNVVRFRLERGDILWVNNRLVAHNRTAYQDTPNNVRQLQRMWVSRTA
ncbi:MAG: alpha-ketoglutarate-dependent taurine dioxygenase [Hyphomicrobiaceae bacterium]|jgi:alpha-ketoglutarate-dependent taurine dioxygenase